MELGARSISLAVKDIEASRGFYEEFGFKIFAEDASRNWLILKNGDHVIGLFQGMFERNILTFNPGWDSDAQRLDSGRELARARVRTHRPGIRWSLGILHGHAVREAVSSIRDLRVHGWCSLAAERHRAPHVHRH